MELSVIIQMEIMKLASNLSRANIEKVNRLYDAGYEIVYWTARGGTTGIDWTSLTTEQLKKWGAKYTELQMRKPHYDLFICDKAINSEEFFGE